jgi:hypothetical protein
MYVKNIKNGGKAGASRLARPAESAGTEFEKKRKDMIKAVGAAVQLPPQQVFSFARQRNFIRQLVLPAAFRVEAAILRWTGS